MREILDLLEHATPRLGQYATIKINDPDADFWVIRRGTEDVVGSPTKEFSPEAYGVKVRDPDMLVPQYLFYLMQHRWMQGTWRAIATGTTRLVNIKASDLAAMLLA